MAMYITDIPSDYTHVHFGCGNITEDYNVDISNVQYDFDDFVGMPDIKKVLSFGGWSFSTELDTYAIFREGVVDAQRQTFATNVTNFIQESGLDGVDFDWEYPGVPAIPGIPAGSESDGPNYVKFLKMIREALPSEYTISIGAPASY